MSQAPQKPSDDRVPHLCECGDHAFFSLTKGFVTLVDPEDAYLGENLWAAKAVEWTVYASRIVPDETFIHKKRARREVKLHREIAGAPKDAVVDHRNGDGLDNRRRNLRVTTQNKNSQNRRRSKNNTSGINGVHKHGTRWVARIGVDWGRIVIGGYATLEEAEQAYTAAAAKHYGEFASVGR